jgi:hypothetical protein
VVGFFSIARIAMLAAAMALGLLLAPAGSLGIPRHAASIRKLRDATGIVFVVAFLA